MGKATRQNLSEVIDAVASYLDGLSDEFGVSIADVLDICHRDLHDEQGKAAADCMRAWTTDCIIGDCIERWTAHNN